MTLRVRAQILARTVVKSMSALMMLCFFLLIMCILFSTLIFMVEKGEYDPQKQQYVREDGEIRCASM